MTFDPKWANNLITFQEINFYPSRDWSNSKVLFTLIRFVVNRKILFLL